MESGGPKSILITHIMMNICATSNGIDDVVLCLNTPMTHPPMPQDATIVDAKELSAKELTIINSALAHVNYKHYRCISLKTLMYIQYKYFNKIYG
jgi:hypothetical protein